MKMIFQLLTLCGAIALSGCAGHSTPSIDAQTAADSITAGNPVIETILARRSIRQYKPQPIEPEKMQRIIECGIFAPNGRSQESWEVRIVDNSEFMAEIDSLYSAYTQNASKIEAAMHPAAYGAPTLVFIAFDTTYDVSPVDCGMLGANMILAAQSMGIGSCCLGGIARFMNAPEASALLKRLRLPSTHKLLYAIALGYPNETPAPKERNMNKVQFIN